MKSDNFILVVDGNKYLGNLLYLKDAKGRTSLKFTFKNKVSPLKLFNKVGGKFNEIDLKNPHETKNVKDGMSFDISYKFSDHKLEVKSEIKKGSIERTFYTVKYPFDTYLFLLRLKNKEELDTIELTGNELVLCNKNFGEQIVSIFSLEGPNGLPFVENVDQSTRVIEEIKLQFSNDDETVHIITLVDTNPMAALSFILDVPHPVTKTT